MFFQRAFKHLIVRAALNAIQLIEADLFFYDYAVRR